MDKAFVLGAGLGTRLKTLTEHIPKPLVPVYNRPLITYAFDHLLDIGFKSFIVNTHHRAGAYRDRFPKNTYSGAPLTFRHEPDLLETGGGIANIADLVADEPFLVYNGDILTDVPLRPLLDAHRNSSDRVTLLLRSAGPALHIAWDPDSRKVLDIRDLAGTGAPCRYQFTGIYAVSPDFLSLLTPGKKESVIPIFLALIRSGKGIGAVVSDDGLWRDLGDRDAYLDANNYIADARFPGYGRTPEQVRIHQDARIDPEALVCEHSSVGAGAIVEAGARVENCILWPGSRVAADSRVKACILRDNAVATGTHENVDF